MRIVGGIYRGRTIEAPRGRDTTRPTTDRVREALMSSAISRLGGSMDGVRILDAFAGSGAFGLEGLSRGAASCTFIDEDRTALAVVQGNVDSLRIPSAQVVLRRMDIYQGVKRVPGGPFSLVFLDPPYAHAPADVCALVEALGCACALMDGAVILYEHTAERADDVLTCAEENGLKVLGQRRYGKTEVTQMLYGGLEAR